MLTLTRLGEFVARHHTRDLFRLETLPRYTSDSDGDDFRRYLRGEPAPNAEARKPWLDRLRTDVDTGRHWRKVHLAHQPITDYERYEFEWGFAFNITAGEQIRIGQPTVALEQVGDFFVLDHEYVVRSRYDGDGRFVHAYILDDPAPLIAVADLLWDQAEDFSTWWALHPELHRDASKVA